MKQLFTKTLLRWHQDIDRNYPWKKEKEAYKIWLAEVILQQTRSEQGLPYYQKFVSTYPTVSDLAGADEDEVLKLWQGLGYYSRARNLHGAAKLIAEELNGVFPSTYDEIRKLKGVGDYTASAIASFAYGLPHAVVDGNVYRVLSRVFGIRTPIDSTEGKKEFAKLADELLDKVNPGAYNHAIMDFGSLQCAPKNPDCGACPMNSACQAYKKEEVSLLPIKAKKTKVRPRYFHYLIMEQEGSIWLNKRTEKDIWKNLYEYPLIETAEPLTATQLKKTEGWKTLFGDAELKIELAGDKQQMLSHQKIYGRFYRVLNVPKNANTEGLIRVGSDKIDKFAFPRIVDRFLEDNSLYLDIE